MRPATRSATHKKPLPNFRARHMLGPCHLRTITREMRMAARQKAPESTPPGACCRIFQEGRLNYLLKMCHRKAPSPRLREHIRLDYKPNNNMMPARSRQKALVGNGRRIRQSAAVKMAAVYSHIYRVDGAYLRASRASHSRRRLAL